MNVPSRRAQLRAVPQSDAAATDAVILEAFEQNSPEFGKLFYDHLIRTVEGNLLRVMGERATEHDDLVQNTFEQILLSLVRKRYQRACSLKSWAAAITTRVGLNAIRSRKTQRKYFEPSSEDASSAEGPSFENPNRMMESRSLLLRVREEISALSAPRAEAVVLHDVLGHELSEVAALTNVTVAAAQSRLVRGRKQLHERLREKGLLEKLEEK
jgi:RNA polymerase sigma-70 factor (ECF subfamily)